MERPRTEQKYSADRIRNRVQTAAASSLENLADRVLGSQPPDAVMNDVFGKLDKLSKSTEKLPDAMQAHSRKQTNILTKCLSRLEEDLDFVKLKIFDFLGIYISPEERCEWDARLAERPMLDETSVDPWEIAAAEMDSQFRFFFEEFALRFKATLGLDPSDPVTVPPPSDSAFSPISSPKHGERLSIENQTDASSSAAKQFALKQSMFNSGLKQGIYQRDVDSVKKDLQVMLLKRQVTRRNDMLTEARSKYYRELVALRQEVLQREQLGDNYQVDVKQFIDWDNMNFGDGEESQEKAEEIMRSKIFKRTMAKVDEMRTQHEAELRTLSLQVTQLKRAIDHKEGEIETWKRKLTANDESWFARVKTEYPDPEEFKTLKTEVQVLQQNMSEKQEVMDGLRFQVSDLTLALEHSKEQASAAEDTARDLITQLDTSEQSRRVLEQEIREIQNRVKERESECAEFEKRVVEKDEMLLEQAEKLKEAQTSFEEMKQKSEELQSQVSQLSKLAEGQSRDLEKKKKELSEKEATATATAVMTKPDLLKKTESFRSQRPASPAQSSSFRSQRPASPAPPAPSISMASSVALETAERRAREQEEAKMKAESEIERLKAENERLRQELLSERANSTRPETQVSELPPVDLSYYERPMPVAFEHGSPIVITNNGPPVVTKEEVEELSSLFQELQSGIEELRVLSHRSPIISPLSTRPQLAPPSMSLPPPLSLLSPATTPQQPSPQQPTPSQKDALPMQGEKNSVQPTFVSRNETNMGSPYLRPFTGGESFGGLGLSARSTVGDVSVREPPFFSAGSGDESADQEDRARDVLMAESEGHKMKLWKRNAPTQSNGAATSVSAVSSANGTRAKKATPSASSSSSSHLQGPPRSFYAESLEVFNRLERRAQKLYEKLKKKREDFEIARNAELERVLLANHHLSSKHNVSEDCIMAVAGRAATYIDTELIPVPSLYQRTQKSDPPSFITGLPPPSVPKPVTAMSHQNVISTASFTGGGEFESLSFGSPRPATSPSLASPPIIGILNAQQQQSLFIGAASNRAGSPSQQERKWPTSFVTYKSKKSYDYQQISPVRVEISGRARTAVTGQRSHRLKGPSHHHHQKDVFLGSDESLSGGDSDSEPDFEKSPTPTPPSSHPKVPPLRQPAQKTSFVHTHHQPVSRVQTWNIPQERGAGTTAGVGSQGTGAKIAKRQGVVVAPPPTAPGLSRLERAPAPAAAEVNNANSNINTTSLHTNIFTWEHIPSPSGLDSKRAAASLCELSPMGNESPLLRGSSTSALLSQQENLVSENGGREKDGQAYGDHSSSVSQLSHRSSSRGTVRVSSAGPSKGDKKPSGGSGSGGGDGVVLPSLTGQAKPASATSASNGTSGGGGATESAQQTKVHVLPPATRQTR